jgi:hypothetical protein
MLNNLIITISEFRKKRYLHENNFSLMIKNEAFNKIGIKRSKTEIINLLNISLYESTMVF